jgi:hypothetical protein
MKRLDARAERLDTDRYRPRDTNSPRAELRPARCPARPGTRRPGPAIVLGRCVRRRTYRRILYGLMVRC